MSLFFHKKSIVVKSTSCQSVILNRDGYDCFIGYTYIQLREEPTLKRSKAQRISYRAFPQQMLSHHPYSQAHTLFSEIRFKGLLKVALKCKTNHQGHYGVTYGWKEGYLTNFALATEYLLADCFKMSPDLLFTLLKSFFLSPSL